MSRELVAGRATPTLLDRTDDSGLVVVGNRGRGGFASLLLGSVSQQVATHAKGPIAIVRGRVDAATGDIAVGVDGASGSTPTLAAAFDEAARRGARLSVVYVSAAASTAWGHDVAPYVDDEGMHDLVTAREVLAEEIASWAAKFPDVVVEPVALGGSPPGSSSTCPARPS